MRLTGSPGEWLWRRLRLGTWFARRKAEKLTGTTAEAGPDAAGRVADRVTGREKAPSRQRGKGTRRPPPPPQEAALTRPDGRSRGIAAAAGL